MSARKKYLLYFTAFIVSAYFLFLGLAKAKGFLAPLVTAVILSLLMLPLAQRFEKVMGRSWAAFANTFIIFIISLGFFGMVSYQFKNLAEDWNIIRETMKPKIEQVKQFAVSNTPFTMEDLKGGEADSKENSSDLGLPFSRTKTAKRAASMLENISSFLSNYLLTFIYLFFLLAYRSIFKNFILRIFKDKKREKVKEIIYKSVKVVPQYLIGKLMLMGLLAVIYSIGLGISGVSNFILVSVIAAVLTLIPYVGNVIGFMMAVVFGYLTTGSLMTLAGIALTFTITQFIESYVLQPYIIGDRVDVHPLFIILSVILGNTIWGIIGMILAIPIMGIIAVIFLNIEKLKPFGKLLSKEKFSEE